MLEVGRLVPLNSLFLPTVYCSTFQFLAWYNVTLCYVILNYLYSSGKKCSGISHSSFNIFHIYFCLKDPVKPIKMCRTMMKGLCLHNLEITIVVFDVYCSRPQLAYTGSTQYTNGPSEGFYLPRECTTISINTQLLQITFNSLSYKATLLQRERKCMLVNTQNCINYDYSKHSNLYLTIKYNKLWSARNCSINISLITLNVLYMFKIFVHPW